MAKTHLVDCIIKYKQQFGKSFVDQTQLVPEQFQELIWWLYPSQVVQDLFFKQKNILFGTIEEFADDIQSDLVKEDWSTPFIPKDYNRGTFEFEFCQEYIG